MKKTKIQNPNQAGFTIIEILMVVVILSIAAMIVVPALSSAADMQVRSAANAIAADLDYARGLAITHQKNYSVIFDAATESYEIQDADGVITNPLTNQPFSWDIDADSRLRQVDVDDADFDGDDSVTFDYLGAPFVGGVAMDSGLITLQDKNAAFKLYVKVEPATGYVTIDDAP